MVAGLSRWRRMNPSDRIKLSVAFSKPSAHHAALTHTHTHTFHLQCKKSHTQNTKDRGTNTGQCTSEQLHLIDTVQHKNTQLNWKLSRYILGYYRIFIYVSFHVIIYLMKIKLTILKDVFFYHNITLKRIWAAFSKAFHYIF